MRYVAAYLLAVLGGNNNPTETDIKKILSSVGVDVDPVCLKKVIDQLKGKNIEELIEEGRKKLASMPAGGAGLVAASAAAAAAPAAAAAAADDKGKPEAAKAKEKEPESGSEDEDMGFGLFD